MDSTVEDCSISEGVEVGEASRKTPVSILQEFCTAFSLGAPFYNLEGATGEAHDKAFQMSLVIPSLEISEVGEAKTKMQAKHNAASKLMHAIKNAASTGISWKGISQNDLVNYSDWLSKYQLVGEDYHASVIKNCAGLLMEWALTRELALPEYETASVSGPAHNRTFVMVCKFQDNQTQGEGKTKKLAKHIAADKMLTIIGYNSDHSVVE